MSGWYTSCVFWQLLTLLNFTQLKVEEPLLLALSQKTRNSHSIKLKSINQFCLNSCYKHSKITSHIQLSKNHWLSNQIKKNKYWKIKDIFTRKLFLQSPWKVNSLQKQDINTLLDNGKEEIHQLIFFTIPFVKDSTIN